VSVDPKAHRMVPMNAVDGFSVGTGRPNLAAGHGRHSFFRDAGGLAVAGPTPTNANGIHAVPIA